VWLFVALCSAVAQAEPRSVDPKVKEARALFQAATSHFAIGEFGKAAEEYQQAYQLKPDPALLYNAAQSLRLSNQLERALVLYRNYLNLYPKEPNAVEVRAQIGKLKEAIASAEQAKSAPPLSTVASLQGDDRSEPSRDPAREPSLKAAPASEQAASPVAQPASTPVYRRWWLWTVVGVVVVGGVTGGVLAATLPSGTWANSPTVGPGAALTVGF
jgi:tetratricopeptide (TPR) repeat protein